MEANKAHERAALSFLKKKVANPVNKGINISKTATIIPLSPKGEFDFKKFKKILYPHYLPFFLLSQKELNNKNQDHTYYHQ
jgi:hypothetical protein